MTTTIVPRQPRQPSLGEILGTAFGQSFQKALPQGMALMQKLGLQHKAEKQKGLEGAREKIAKHLKTFHKGLFDDEIALNSIADDYYKLIESGADSDAAQKQAINLWRQKEGSVKEEENKKERYLGMYTPEEIQKSEAPYGYGSAAKAHPLEALSNLLRPFSEMYEAGSTAIQDPTALGRRLFGDRKSVV